MLLIIFKWAIVLALIAGTVFGLSISRIRKPILEWVLKYRGPLLATAAFFFFILVIAILGT